MNSKNSLMILIIVILTITYGALSYAEQRANITKYTIMSEMFNIINTSENKFELYWAFLNLDNMRDVVQIDPRIARLVVKRVEQEALSADVRLELD